MFDKLEITNNGNHYHYFCSFSGINISFSMEYLETKIIDILKVIYQYQFGINTFMNRSSLHNFESVLIPLCINNKYEKLFDEIISSYTFKQKLKLYSRNNEFINNCLNINLGVLEMNERKIQTIKLQLCGGCKKFMYKFHYHSCGDSICENCFHSYFSLNKGESKELPKCECHVSFFDPYEYIYRCGKCGDTGYDNSCGSCFLEEMFHLI